MTARILCRMNDHYDLFTGTTQMCEGLIRSKLTFLMPDYLIHGLSERKFSCRKQEAVRGRARWVHLSQEDESEKSLWKTTPKAFSTDTVGSSSLIRADVPNDSSRGASVSNHEIWCECSSQGSISQCG